MKQRAKGKKQRAKSKEPLAKSIKQRAKGVKPYALCSLLFACFLLFAHSGCATTDIKESTQPEEAPVITGIDLQDNLVTVKANKPFSYTMYRPDDPYKVVVELLDVSSGAFNMKIVSDKAGITEIVPYQIESPSFMTKLEILLQTPSEAEPEYKDNELKIRIKGEVPKKEELPKEVLKILKEKEEAVEKKEPEVAAPSPEEIPLPKATEITGISFERAADKIKVLIKGNGSMEPSVFNLDKRIIIDIPDVIMSAQLPSAVVTPIKGIRSGKHDDKTRLVIDLKEKTDFDVTTIGDSIILALLIPMAERVEEKAEAEEGKEPEALIQGKYTGKKISLDFQDADIVPIFRLLADISGYNIVVSPEVKGKLTMKLINVPWDQVLDIILKTFSLGKSVEGNIIRIAPHTIFAKESEDATKAKDAEIKAVPLETRIFSISYADVSNIEKSIKDAKILSPRGSISIDKRTSSLTVYDVPVVFPQVENLLMTLDKPTPQVMIEARIVEVSSSDLTSLGIQWGVSHVGPATDIGSKPFRGNTSLLTGPFTGNNFMVDFPSADIGHGAGAGFAFGILNTTRTMGLDLQLSALQTIGRTKILSNPRIVTTDNEKAIIKQGESIPYAQVDVASGQISAAFKDIVITIEVTPHITPSGSINTLVYVKKEDLKEFVNLGSAGNAPRTTLVESTTKVLIENSETLVIGGVLKKAETESTSGVPGLMKIPVLGWLFKSRKTTNDTTELLIFITPKILEKPT